MNKSDVSVFKIFANRHDAGEKLSFRMQHFATKNTTILALPRGGVEVAFPISQRLHIPIDIIIARKIAVPSHPEVAIGAISEFDVTCINTAFVKQMHLSRSDIAQLINVEKREIQRRLKLYRNNRDLSHIQGSTVFVVDDGVATGLTAQAALQSIRMLQPKKIIFATPVCAFATLPRIQMYADRVISLLTPQHLHAVSNYYRQFHQVTDERVIELLSVSHSTLPIFPGYLSHKRF